MGFFCSSLSISFDDYVFVSRRDLCILDLFPNV
jgi:hypothetical protein